jgi:branched-chain amino acid transport system substrate-binding protein
VQRQTVLISESATNSLITDLEDENFVFRMMPPDSIQGTIAAQEAWDSGHRSVAILRRDDAYASGLATRFAQAFEQLGGEVRVEQSYDISGDSIANLQEHSFDSELDAIFGQEPDLIYLLAFDEVAQISRRIAERGDIDSLPSGDVRFLAADALYDVGALEGCSPVLLDRLTGTTPGVNENLIAFAMQSADSLESAVFKDHIASVSREDGDDTVLYLNDFARGREALLAGSGINYDGASGPIELTNAGDPAAGHYLVWNVDSSDFFNDTATTEKTIPF